MKRYAYPATLTKQDGGYLVRFIDFPEAITDGRTEAEALTNAADCLDEAIANRIFMNIELPPQPTISTHQHILISVSRYDVII